MIRPPERASFRLKRNEAGIRQRCQLDAHGAVAGCGVNRPAILRTCHERVAEEGEKQPERGAVQPGERTQLNRAVGRQPTTCGGNLFGLLPHLEGDQGSCGRTVDDLVRASLPLVAAGLAQLR